MTEYDRIREFYKYLRKRDYDGALRVNGYYVSRPGTITSKREPTTPRSAHSGALDQRHRVCLLIERGLTHHGHRLFHNYWRALQTDLQQIDPGAARLRLVLGDAIRVTQQVAVQCGESLGVWNLMEAAAFQTWAENLVAALKQYRRICGAADAR